MISTSNKEARHLVATLGVVLYVAALLPGVDAQTCGSETCHSNSCPSSRPNSIATRDSGCCALSLYFGACHKCCSDPPATCLSMTSASCSSSSTGRFDYGASMKENGATFYCCNSNGKFCQSSATQSECPTPIRISPPPPSPSPSPLPPPALTPPRNTSSETGDALDTTKSCKCSCCNGNGCTSSIVASYSASSSSDCGADSCRSQFSSVCPASGSSGSVQASYSSSSSASSGITPPSMGLETGHMLKFISSSAACGADNSCDKHCAAGYVVTKFSETSYRLESTAVFPSGITGCEYCYRADIEGTLSGSGASSKISGTAEIMGPTSDFVLMEAAFSIERKNEVYSASSFSEVPGCIYSYTNPSLARSAGSRSTPTLIAVILALMSVVLTFTVI